MSFPLKTAFFRQIIFFSKVIKYFQNCIKLDNFVINRYNTRCCRYEMSKSKAERPGFRRIDDDMTYICEVRDRA